LATDKLIYKLAIKHRAAILKLFGISDGEKYVASSFTFKATENRRDLIFEKLSGEEVWFVESQGYADAHVHHGLLDGIMMYCRQKEFSGEFRAAIIFLKRSHHRAALKLAHHFDGHAELTFRPLVLVMDQIGLEELERLKDVRLIPLYPICKISPRQIEASMPDWAERIKRANKITEAERTDLLALLGGFATHRDKRFTLEKINKLFGGFKMEETTVGKELIQIGVRRVILRQITRRFGTVPVTIRRQIEKIDKIKQLEHIADGLLEVKDLKQLRKLVGPNGKFA
jgi:Protein of unknown function (DUF2887)/Domain of unknown function (DUF4351)